MSRVVVERVLRHSKLGDAALLALLVIAHHADDRGRADLTEEQIGDDLIRVAPLLLPLLPRRHDRDMPRRVAAILRRSLDQ